MSEISMSVIIVALVVGGAVFFGGRALYRRWQAQKAKPRGGSGGGARDDGNQYRR